jgi:hypothetical protein
MLKDFLARFVIMKIAAGKERIGLCQVARTWKFII